MDDRDSVLGEQEPLAQERAASRSWPAALRSPATVVVAAVALAFAVGAGAGLLGGDDDEPQALPAATGAPSPAPSPSPSPVAPPSAPPSSAAPSPVPSTDPSLDPSCSTDAPSVAVCRFVRALQTDDVSALTPGERRVIDTDDDLPDASFSVTSCDLEGDVTVLCEVAFADDVRTSAGFRLQPSNGSYDAETGEVVVEPGQTLAYEVVEAVGLRRDREPAASAPAAAGELVLGGDDLGVTRVGAPYREAVAALSRVLGPPVADPAPSTACVGSGDREVEWRGFRLAVTDGEVSGWSSSDPRLRTPSDLGVGSTVAELQQVLGDALQLYEPTPDSTAGFTVDGVELGGGLTGTGPDDEVTGFHNGACAPP